MSTEEPTYEPVASGELARWRRIGVEPGKLLAPREASRRSATQMLAAIAGPCDALEGGPS